MSILHKIRRKTLFSRVLFSALMISLLLLPFASWSVSNHGKQTTSQPNHAMEMSSGVSMTNCNHQSKNINQENCGKNCCENLESNQNCKDCPNSCTPPVFFSLISDSLNQIINSHRVVQNIQSAISSRKITPPFRPPITLLS